MCNQGAFFGKGVRSHFKALQKSDDEILSTFSTFGETPTVTEDIIVQIERYICLLYANSPERTIQGMQYQLSITSLFVHISPLKLISFWFVVRLNLSKN